MDVSREANIYVINTVLNSAGSDDVEEDLNHLADDTNMTENRDTLGHPADLDQNTGEVIDPDSERSSVVIEEEFNDDEDNNTPISHDLQQGLRILKELMADSNKSVNWPFMDPVDCNHTETLDYYDKIKNPVWFRKSMNDLSLPFKKKNCE